MITGAAAVRLMRRRIATTAGVPTLGALAVLAAARPAFAAGMPQLQFGNPLTTGQLF